MDDNMKKEVFAVVWMALLYPILCNPYQPIGPNINTGGSNIQGASGPLSFGHQQAYGNQLAQNIGQSNEIGAGGLPTPACQPVSLENGNCTYDQTPHIEGSKVTCTCDTNYNKTEGDAERMCTADLIWDKTGMKCSEILCSASPPAKDNALIAVTGNKVDSKAVFTCRGGYRASGNGTVMCRLSGKWSTSDFKCTEIVCPAAPQVENANAASSASSHKPGTTVKYTCNYGYRLSGTAQTTCDSKGSWSDRNFKCEAITQCPAPPAIANANVSPSGVAKIGATATYTCNTGYGAPSNVNNVIKCQGDGTWTEISSFVCKEILCPSSPVAISMATVTTTGSKPGATGLYTCNSGYKATGNGAIKCQSNGQWTTSSIKCTEIPCNAPPTVTMANYSPSKSVYQSGEKVTYSCDQRYYDYQSGPKSKTCNKGSWVPAQNIACRIAYTMRNGDCGNFDIENMNATVLQGEHPEKCRARCDQLNADCLSHGKSSSGLAN